MALYNHACVNLKQYVAVQYIAKLVTPKICGQADIIAVLHHVVVAVDAAAVVALAAVVLLLSF